MQGHLTRGLALLAILSASCLAQVTLENKFREGDSYSMDTSTELTQKMTIAGTEIDTSSTSLVTSTTSIGKRDIESKLRVGEKVTAMKATISVMGQTYEFDSTMPDQKGSSPLEIVRNLHKALLNRTTTIVYDKDNKAVDVEVDQDLLTGLPPEIEPLVKGQLDPKALKANANETLDQIKSDPIKPGDTWRRSKGQNLGAGQVMAFETEYTYIGTEKKNGREADKITGKVLSISFSFENSPLPIQLKDSKLEPKDSETTIWFDRELGRIVDSTSNLRIVGEITFTANNTDLPAKLDLLIKSSTIQKP